jgi:lipopolysaccharide/colanic/teichoic acid biosynthesis glycosyltransferase
LYRRRLDIKPGLTGWAQVKYRYTRTDKEALVKLQYDLYYIKHRSIKIDMLIILKTIVEVLSYHGT